MAGPIMTRTRAFARMKRHSGATAVRTTRYRCHGRHRGASINMHEAMSTSTARAGPPAQTILGTPSSPGNSLSGARPPAEKRSSTTSRSVTVHPTMSAPPAWRASPKS